jgi:hypothetical protein
MQYSYQVSHLESGAINPAPGRESVIGSAGYAVPPASAERSDKHTQPPEAAQLLFLKNFGGDFVAEFRPSGRARTGRSPTPVPYFAGGEFVSSLLPAPAIKPSTGA